MVYLPTWRILQPLTATAKRLKRELTALYYAYRDPATSLLPKLIILLTLGYALSPIDLIPDFIPVLGYLDDLVILPALIALSIKLIPEAALDAARSRAAEEPIRLKKNWAFGVVFALIWVAILAALVAAVWKIF